MSRWIELIAGKLLLESKCILATGLASSDQTKLLNLVRFIYCVMLSLQLEINFGFQRLCKVIFIKQVVRRQIRTHEWFRFGSSEVCISNNLIALGRLSYELAWLLNIELFSITLWLVFILGWLLDGLLRLQFIIFSHLIFMQGLSGFSDGLC
jgi:hypothetical protein